MKFKNLGLSLLRFTLSLTKDLKTNVRLRLWLKSTLLYENLKTEKWRLNWILGRSDNFPRRWSTHQFSSALDVTPIYNFITRKNWRIFTSENLWNVRTPIKCITVRRQAFLVGRHKKLFAEIICSQWFGYKPWSKTFFTIWNIPTKI